MHQTTQSIQTLTGENSECGHVVTSLYELIELINEELRPGEEELLERVVMRLAEDQQIQSVTDR